MKDQFIALSVELIYSQQIAVISMPGALMNVMPVEPNGRRRL